MEWVPFTTKTVQQQEITVAKKTGGGGIGILWGEWGHRVTMTLFQSQILKKQGVLAYFGGVGSQGDHDPLSTSNIKKTGGYWHTLGGVGSQGDHDPLSKSNIKKNRGVLAYFGGSGVTG